MHGSGLVQNGHNLSVSAITSFIWDFISFALMLRLEYSRRTRSPPLLLMPLLLGSLGHVISGQTNDIKLK